MDARLSAQLEVSGLVRQVQAAGGFAVVAKRGDREAGSILLVLAENGTNLRLFERMPDLHGHRKWTLVSTEDVEDTSLFQQRLDRRASQDPDLWIVELDIVNAERFIGLTASRD